MIHIFVLFHGFLLHLVELFLLRGRENAVDLVVCGLVNYFLFGALLVRGKRRIVPEFPQLLSLILQNGLQFCLLILGEIQFLAEHLQMSVWASGRARCFVALWWC